MKKEIHDVKDVGRFARSKAFCKIMHFLSSCSGYLEQCRFSEVKEDKSSPVSTVDGLRLMEYGLFSKTPCYLVGTGTIGLSFE